MRSSALSDGHRILRWISVLVVAVAACGEDTAYEWLVQIDENWGSPEERQAVLEEEVAVLRSRMEAFTSGEVEPLDNGQILIRYAGDFLEPLFVPGSVTLHLVTDSVDLRSILPELDSVLAAHSPVPTPGVIPGTQALPLLEPEGAYPIRDTDIEEVRDYLVRSGAVRALGPDRTFVFGFFGERGERVWYLYLIQADPFFTSGDVERADPLESKGIWKVLVTLTREAGSRVETSTARHVGGHVALVLDGVVMGRPAVIRQPVGRHMSLDAPAGSTYADAQWLATFFRAGPLPAPLVPVE